MRFSFTGILHIEKLLFCVGAYGVSPGFWLFLHIDFFKPDMGKNKLKKFKEMEEIDLVFQYPWAALQDKEFPLRGKWHEEFFHNDNPIVLELGCGKGEYSVGLAEAHPEANYIGIDIKGARMCREHAKHATKNSRTWLFSEPTSNCFPLSSRPARSARYGSRSLTPR